MLSIVKQMTSIHIPDHVHRQACAAALQAGKIMLDYEDYFQKLFKEYGADVFDDIMQSFVRTKVEETSKGKRESKITDADIESHYCLKRLLRSILPDVPIISEENSKEENESILKANPRIFWVIDGLDGTETFAGLLAAVKPKSKYTHQHHEFSINISLVVDGQPEVGVVYFPSLKKIFFTDSKNAYKLEGVNIGSAIYNYNLEKDFLTPPSIPYDESPVWIDSFKRKCAPISDDYQREYRMFSCVYGMRMHEEGQSEVRKRIKSLFSPDNLDYCKLPMTPSWNDDETYAEPRIMNEEDIFRRGAGQHRGMEVLAERSRDVGFNGPLNIWDYAATAAFAKKSRGIIMKQDVFEQILLEGNPRKRYPIIPDIDWRSLDKISSTVVLFPWAMDTLLRASASKKGKWTQQDEDRFEARDRAR